MDTIRCKETTKFCRKVLNETCHGKNSRTGNIYTWPRSNLCQSVNWNELFWLQSTEVRWIRSMTLYLLVYLPTGYVAEQRSQVCDPRSLLTLSKIEIIEMARWIGWYWMCTNVYIHDIGVKNENEWRFCLYFWCTVHPIIFSGNWKALTCFLVFTQGGSSQMYRNYQITRGEQSEAANPS